MKNIPSELSGPFLDIISVIFGVNHNLFHCMLVGKNKVIFVNGTYMLLYDIDQMLYMYLNPLDLYAEL